jgi:WD40 repeat protein
MKPFDNLISKQRTNIAIFLNNFLPNDISKLISNYDYFLEGNAYTLEERVDNIKCLAQLPDGRLVSVSNENVIKIWDLNTGTCDITHKEQGNQIKYINVLPNGPSDQGQRIFIAFYNGTFKIWNPLLQDKIITFKDNYDVLDCIGVLLDDSSNILCPSYHIIIATYTDDVISFKICNTRTEKCDLILERKRCGICCAIFPNEQIIIEYRDNELEVLDIRTKKSQIIYRKFYEKITCACVLHNRRIVIGDEAGHLEILDPKNEVRPDRDEVTLEQNNTVFEYHENKVNCVSVLPDGRIISCCDNELKIGNPITAKCDKTLKGHTDEITCMIVLADGRIISGSCDKTIKIWS